jgi:hypothetical protein
MRVENGLIVFYFKGQNIYLEVSTLPIPSSLISVYIYCRKQCQIPVSDAMTRGDGH